MYDMWSYFEITGIIDEKGYKDVETLWYKAAGRDLNDGLKQLVDDAGALEMIRIAKCEGCVHLYVLHPEIVHHIVGNERNDLPENHIAQDNIPQETPMAEDNVSIQ
ncbi:hypothetical protein AAZV13_10G059200 [Glycine max]